MRRRRAHTQFPLCDCKVVAAYTSSPDILSIADKLIVHLKALQSPDVFRKIPLIVRLYPPGGKSRPESIRRFFHSVADPCEPVEKPWIAWILHYLLIEYWKRFGEVARPGEGITW